MAQNAPGKSHREGISLVELFQRFPNDAAAEAWFEEQRWGQAGKPTHCPLCGSIEKQRPIPSRKPLPYWCGSCRNAYSVRTGSVMHRSRIGLQKWAIAIYLWSTSLKGVSSMKLHRDLKITQKSAYFMAQRLREAWSESPGGTSGPVEFDEVYFGGKRKNIKKRKELADLGRGTAGKTAAVGAKDRNSNQVVAEVVRSTDKPTLQDFVARSAVSEATVYTDEAQAYQGIPNPHETVNHSVSGYVRGQAHTNGIESFWALLRRGHYGTFHKISPKHLQRYVNEFATRHNMRREDTIVMMEKTVAMMDGKRLTYADMKADNGLPSGART